MHLLWDGGSSSYGPNSCFTKRTNMSNAMLPWRTWLGDLVVSMPEDAAVSAMLPLRLQCTSWFVDVALCVAFYTLGRLEQSSMEVTSKALEALDSAHGDDVILLAWLGCQCPSSATTSNIGSAGDTHIVETGARTARQADWRVAARTRRHSGMTTVEARSRGGARAGVRGGWYFNYPPSLGSIQTARSDACGLDSQRVPP